MRMKEEMRRDWRKGMKTYTKSASIFQVNPPEVIFLVTWLIVSFDQVSNLRNQFDSSSHSFPSVLKPFHRVISYSSFQAIHSSSLFLVVFHYFLAWIIHCFSLNAILSPNSMNEKRGGNIFHWKEMKTKEMKERRKRMEKRFNSIEHDIIYIS